MNYLKEITGPIGIVILISAILIFAFIAFIFRKLEARINILLKDYRELKKESECDTYLINFLTKENEHMADLNDKNEREIKILKEVVNSQEKIIKDFWTELEPVETKVYDSVFSMPIQEPKKPI